MPLHYIYLCIFFVNLTVTATSFSSFFCMSFMSQVHMTSFVNDIKFKWVIIIDFLVHPNT